MQNKNELAPIVLFTYNRLSNTKKTIEHLKKNTLALESDLIIFSDASKDNLNKELVDEVRSYLKSVTGFKSCNLIERKVNFGLAKNIIEGVTEVFKKSKKVIVLEDDLVTSENFLCYMNQALDFYRDVKTVFSISGYTGALPSLVNYNKDTYLSYRVSSWGWGTWKSEWDGLDWEISTYNKFITNKKEIALFNRGGVDMTRMLKHFMKGKNNSWAIRWSYEMYRRKKLCIYPRVSKVINIGFGEEATHCSGTNIYDSFLDTSQECKFKFCDTNDINSKIIKDFRHQFDYRKKIIKKLKAFFKL